MLLLVAALAAGVLDGTRGVGDLLLVACPAVALAAVFLLPALVVDDEALDVVGVLHRRRVPWTAVVQVRQGWFVELDLTDGSRVVCLAAPVVGSMAAFRTLDEDEHDCSAAAPPRTPRSPAPTARWPSSWSPPAGPPAPPRRRTARRSGRPVRRTGPALLLGALALVWCAAAAGLL